MAYTMMPCRGCGGPKGERAKQGVAYCQACRDRLDSKPKQAAGYPERGLRDARRRDEMAGLYMAGQTLREIGALYGVSRERVRQVIVTLGLRAKDGGWAKKAEKAALRREIRRKAARDRRCMSTYGCSHAVLLELNEGQSASTRGSPAKAYLYHRKNAMNRGIGWDITFEEWTAIWRASGHFQERGRGADLYVMARKGDTGPYAADNVYITTMADNVRDYQKAIKRRGVVCPDGYKRLPEAAAKFVEAA